MTKHLALFLAQWAKEILFSSVSEHFHVNWQTIAQSVQWVVEQGLKEKDISNIRTIGIDEVSFHGKSDYFTLVYQLDEGQRRLLWVGDNRTKETLKQFFSEMGVEILKKDSSLYDLYLQENKEGEHPLEKEECSRRPDLQELIANLESQFRQLRQLENESGTKVLSPEESSTVASLMAELGKKLMTLRQLESQQGQDRHEEPSSLPTKEEEYALQSAVAAPPEAVKTLPCGQEVCPAKEADEKNAINPAETEPAEADEADNSDNTKDQKLSTQLILQFLITQFALNIKVVCSDMWRPYQDTVAEYLPEALNILDRFHVMKKFSGAIDKVRNAENKRLISEGMLKVLTGSRYCFLKRPENLTGKQALKLKELLDMNLITVKAYLLKEQFQKL